MLNSNGQSVVIFVISTIILFLLLTSFIVFVIYRYQLNQNTYNKQLEEVRISHESALLQSQLEIQEQTFQNISREIHDNIGQKLTLAKLHLNTLSITENLEASNQVNESVNMISEAINDLSNISRSLSSEVILNNGLIHAIELEKAQLQKAGLFKIHFVVTGNAVFLSNEKELVLFRVMQEAVNNVIKHAAATMLNIYLHYHSDTLILEVADNGSGYIAKNELPHQGIGLANMAKRVNMLNGTFTIKGEPGIGTQLKIEIPYL